MKISPRFIPIFATALCTFLASNVHAQLIISLQTDVTSMKVSEAPFKRMNFRITNPSSDTVFLPDYPFGAKEYSYVYSNVYNINNRDTVPANLQEDDYAILPQDFIIPPRQTIEVSYHAFIFYEVKEPGTYLVKMYLEYPGRYRGIKHAIETNFVRYDVIAD